jgi:NhaP-type Na+/H+ or K+/H+ antiporter
VQLSIERIALLLFVAVSIFVQGSTLAPLLRWADGVSAKARTAAAGIS